MCFRLPPKRSLALAALFLLSFLGTFFAGLVLLGTLSCSSASSARRPEPFFAVSAPSLSSTSPLDAGAASSSAAAPLLPALPPKPRVSEPVATSCPPNAYPGSRCVRVTSLCVRPDYSALVAVSDPAGSTGMAWRAPTGTIVLLNSGDGQAFNTQWRPVTKRLLAAGFRVVEIIGFMSPWQGAVTHSIREAACRPADLVSWARTAFHEGGFAGRGFCGAGIAEGASALADALTFYASPLDRLVVIDGAPFSRIDCGCSEGCGKTIPGTCDGASSLPIAFPQKMRDDVDHWECTSACGLAPADLDLARWRSDSTFTHGIGDLSWGWRAAFATCANAASPAVGQGALLEVALKDEVHVCVPCKGEQVMATPPGRDAVATLLLACAP